jgi:DNA polymerase I-like protein with 3'-5' exonuclease and polymerase domains
VNIIHDEIAVECNIEHKETVEQMLRTAMELACNTIIKQFKTAV